MQVLGFGMRGQGMIIRHKEKAAVFVLHFDKIPDSSKIVPQMEVAGRSYTAQYCVHAAKL
jgi:hypothetical protein